MDNQTPESARIDLPITVESAEPQAPAAASHAARPRACPHRLRWADRSFLSKYATARYALIAVAALAVAPACMVEGSQALRAGFGDDVDFRTRFGMFLGVLAMFAAISLAAGPVEYFRTLRSAHRPNRRVFILHNVGLLVLAGFVLNMLPGREWLVFALVPALLMMQILGALRLQLTERTDCAADPGLPLMLRRSRRGVLPEPDTDEERTFTYGPRVVADGFDSWECPHTTWWRQVRRRAQIHALFANAAQVVYLLGAVATGTALVVNDDRLGIPELEGVALVPFVVLAVLAVLNNLAYQAASAGPHLHRAPMYVVVWSTIGYLLTASLAAWTAVLLDRPYMWAVVPLALYLTYLLVDRTITQTPVSQCQNRPGLHPRILKELRA
ncbi:hypothetical protein [Glycomyces artemisiae]|uniref:Uncharacterized protein n=1 Tax=Glycomyces artemisiae TaxID=1076443 RepID=A0A2T0UT30_9ACTN|nr:hypothetical protein [Glycomyces artemisiae]PRY61085.1 hypothetical protein B0I28_102704 [Glycomyces artemisiae]